MGLRKTPADNKSTGAILLRRGKIIIDHRHQRRRQRQQCHHP